MIIAYFSLGAFGAVLVAGWTFAYFQRRFPTLAEEDRYDDAVHAIYNGIVTIFFWPAMVPMFLILCRFAKHGFSLNFRKGAKPKVAGGAW